jgi:hypothetical protein
MMVVVTRGAMVMAVHRGVMFRRVGNGLHIRQRRAGAERQRSRAQQTKDEFHGCPPEAMSPARTSLGRVGAAGYQGRSGEARLDDPVVSPLSWYHLSVSNRGPLDPQSSALTN